MAVGRQFRQRMDLSGRKIDQTAGGQDRSLLVDHIFVRAGDNDAEFIKIDVTVQLPSPLIKVAVVGKVGAGGFLKRTFNNFVWHVGILFSMYYLGDILTYFVKNINKKVTFK